MAAKKKTTEINSQQVNLNLDTTPVLYTDNVIMTINDDGVVLNFSQSVVSTNKVRIVSRVGMSREHAKKFVNKLGSLLVKSEGKIETGGGLIN